MKREEISIMQQYQYLFRKMNALFEELPCRPDKIFRIFHSGCLIR